MFDELGSIYCPSSDVSAELAQYVEGLGAEGAVAPGPSMDANGLRPAYASNVMADRRA